MFGAHCYGGRVAIVQAEDWVGPSFETCQTYGWVCRAFAETSRRREVLAFSHHREVAALPKKQADQLLDLCLPEGTRPRRSVRWLREEVRRWRCETSLPPVVTRDWADIWQLRTYPDPKDPDPKEQPAAISLDTSAVTGTVPAELAALRPEPTMDHAAIARAALAALEFRTALSIFTAWHATLASAERDAVLAALHEASDHPPTSP